MKTVNEVSKLTGVSVRTLHHYDAIGLLKPAQVTKAGYRLYDDTALKRLQSILIFRELQFPLKEIKAILDHPAFDAADALEQQIKLLELQKKHIEELISFAREIQDKGVSEMKFNAFSKNEIDQYTEEIKRTWGSTHAYKEFEEKTKQKTEFEQEETADRLLNLFTEIGKLKQLQPADKTVQEKISMLQKFITDNYYTCTKEMLIGLSQMYVSDERFKHNIDKAGGEGTAEFVKQAIIVYCS
ncbi:MAG: MerR family transcriptional regulator [Eubacterium sp.]|nr:MerR family transcriptional regulator [Eubacterium sp.]